MDKYRDILGVSSKDGVLIAGNTKLVITDQDDVEGMYRYTSYTRDENGDWVDSHFSFMAGSELIEIAYLLCLRNGLEFFEGIIFDKTFAKWWTNYSPVYFGYFTSPIGTGSYELTVHRDEPIWSLTFDVEI